MTVYGPYTRSDGRQHVIHYDPVTKSRRTQSYPRYLMEIELGRELNLWEDVHHKDENFTNNEVSNLEVKTNFQHLSDHREGKTEYGYFYCPMCGEKFKYPMRRYRHNQLVQGKKGPYCSRSCAGVAKWQTQLT